MEYLLLRWSFLLVTALNENKWKIPHFCNCYRVCWVTQRALRSICAIKRRRVNKIISNERLPLYDRELERDRLCDLSSPTVQSLYAHCPLCEKTHFSENYLQPQLPLWSGSHWNTWALEMQTWQHEWFPCKAWGSRAPNLLHVLSAADSIDLLHLC